MYISQQNDIRVETNYHHGDADTINSWMNESRVLRNLWPMFLFYIPISNKSSRYTTLKVPENIWFSGVFRGYNMKTLVGNGLGIKQKHFEA